LIFNGLSKKCGVISLWTAQNFTAIISLKDNNGMYRSQTWRCAAIAEDDKTMRYLHTMVRVRDVDESLDFYCNKLGLVEMRRKDVPEGRFTLIFLAAPKDQNNSAAQNAPELELTYNWDPEDYDYGRNFGHLAYKVDNIYQTCQALADAGVTINRPPRDGRMAFIKSPDNISIELLQEGDALAPAEPWLSMENTGTW
jgi:lactoylglutathione lyase